MRNLLRFVCSLTLLVVLLSAGTTSGAAAANAKKSKDAAKAGAAQSESPFVNFGEDEQIEKLHTELNALIDASRWEEAVRKGRDMQKMTQQVFGVKSPQYIYGLSDQGWLEQQSGNYVEARRLFEAAIAAQDAVLKPNDVHLSLPYNNLANLLMFQGDYPSAQPLLEKALSIQKALYGNDSADVAKTLSNLGVLVANRGNVQLALRYYTEALSIQEKDPETTPSELAATINNLGYFRQKVGDLRQAKTLYERALAIRERNLGENHPDVADTLINMSPLVALEGNNAGAIAMLERAVGIYKQTMGVEHPSVVTALNALGGMYFKTGNQVRARACFVESAEIVNKLITNLLPALSFAEQRAFLEQRVPEETSILCSVFDSNTDIPKAYSYLFRWKGLLVEALRWQNNLRKLSGRPDLAESVNKLNMVRRELADWYYKAGNTQAEEWQKKNQELIASKEQLERKLGAAGEEGGVRDSLSSVSLDQFRSLMQPRECLIDIFKYRRQLSVNKPFSAYGAIVTSAKQPPQFVDLGEADSMDAAISNWRKEVIARRSSAPEFVILRDKAWKPFRNVVPTDCTRVWLNSDSELARVPWHLFPAEDSAPMLISQLDSNRELAKLRSNSDAPPSNKSTMLIAGGIDFGKAEFVQGDSVYMFGPLPGTLVEADQIARLAAGQKVKTELLTADQPTKRRLLADIPDAQWVHLATHGYFLDERQGAKSRNPLLDSGLLTAKPAEGETGSNQFLTAEELVGANFADAKLVTLSACETGLGEEATGQGVLGLRAAIMAAGARCIVMSLWKVPDEATLLLMDRFYKNLWEKKMPIAEALRTAQLSVRDEPSNEFAYPVHWAGWICVGDAW